ncbi:MAG: hypothetical protein ACQESE_03335 [Nanobdellota archaeon]
MSEPLLSPEAISRMDSDENDHIIYYTFLRPIEEEYRSLIEPKKGITLSRTFEGVCSPEEFRFYVSQVTKDQPVVKGMFSGIEYFGKDNDIPVLTIESGHMVGLHKRTMNYLLLAGSPYEGRFLHKGHYDIKKMSGQYQLVENQYTPHLSLEKSAQNQDLTQLVGKEFSCTGMFSRVKRFGNWDESITYHPFSR